MSTYKEQEHKRNIREDRISQLVRHRGRLMVFQAIAEGGDVDGVRDFYNLTFYSLLETVSTRGQPIME